MWQAKKTRQGGYAAKLSGELNIYNAAKLKDELMAVLERCTSLSVDMSEVSELDTSCFQLLVQAKKECAKAGKDMRITAHSPAVLEVLDLYGMESYFGDPIILTTATDR